MAFDPEGPEVSAPRPKPERSVAALLSDLAGETILLLRQEMALFKAELHEKFSRAGYGATALGAGGMILYSGWLALLAAAILGLATVLPGWLAALIIGVVVVLVGAVLLLVGKNRLDTKALMPERTLRSLREDEAWLKERLR
ncbi:MAG TPA: phage holin family protein [Stellaceae bacterium]|nr:phage holin family protein [Stellaceae bacterium]